MSHDRGSGWVERLQAPRTAGLAAVLGAVIGIALTPLMASAWAYDDDEPWSDAPALERAVGPSLESWGLLDYGADDLPYHVYGKGFFLVYLLMAPAMLAVHSAAVRNGVRGTFEAWSWRVMFGALLAGAAGDFVAYWGISLPALAGEVVGVLGFLVEFLALPVLLLACTAYGIAAWRAGTMPAWACALLSAAPVAAIATAALVTDYIPNAAVVPLSIVWAILGVWLSLTRDQQPTADATVAIV